MPRLTAPSSRPLTFRIEERSPLWWFRWLPAALFLSLFLYLTVVIGQVAIIPVLASVAIAYVVNPLVEWFQARGLGRNLASLVALGLVATLILVFLFFVIPDLWTQSVRAGDIIIRNLNPENAAAARARIREFSPILERMTGTRIYQFLSGPGAMMETSQAFFTGGLARVITTAAGALDLLIIPFFVYYILVDFSDWRRSVDELIPPRFREPFARLFDETGRILQAYVLGQLMIAMAMAVLYAGGFAALGVPAWAGLATLSGLLNVIPYVGTGAGVILASGFTFADTGQIWRVAGVIGVFGLVQAVEGYILTPRILGSRLSLHPMAVFLGLLIGGRLFGLLGVLLAVPVIAIAQVFFKFAREIYRTSDFYRTGGMVPDPAAVPVEEVMARAADTVLADQLNRQQGDEVLAPETADDDAIAKRGQVVNKPR